MNQGQTICQQLGIDYQVFLSIRKRVNRNLEVTREERDIYNLFARTVRANKPAKPGRPRGPTNQATPHSSYIYKVRVGLHHLITDEERAANTFYHSAEQKMRRKLSQEPEIVPKLEIICADMRLNVDVVRAAQRAYRLGIPLTPEQKIENAAFTHEAKQRRLGRRWDRIDRSHPKSLHSSYQYKIRHNQHDQITDEEREANKKYHLEAQQRKRTKPIEKNRSEAVPDKNSER